MKITSLFEEGCQKGQKAINADPPYIYRVPTHLENMHGKRLELYVTPVIFGIISRFTQVLTLLTAVYRACKLIHVTKE